MRYVSVFSGIEAASVAWGPLGWHPVCFCEVDEFPKAVLRHRFPSVPNLGDITKVDWRSLAKCAGRPDAVVGGSPCQSFSVAGARTGLEGESGLMWEYVRAVRELMPRWVLWENVPGALSSSHGEDFRCLLEALDACGYGLAWRVLDAQFFGLAQRRERLFVVGSLGDGGAERACSVLFEPESLSWDSQSSREKRQELAAGAGGGAEGSGGALNPADPQSKRVFSPCGVAPTLSSGTGQGMNIQPSVLCAGFCAGNTAGAGSIGYQEEVNPTLRAGGSGTNMTPTVFEVQGNDVDRAPENGQWACGPDENGAYTLNSTDVNGVPTFAVLPFNTTQITSKENGSRPRYGDPCHPLCATDHAPAICMADAAANAAIDRDLAGTLKANNNNNPPIVSSSCSVRRLTPRECERLQGFPDDWTLIPYRGKPAEECPDTPRYKAIGNSMAVNVMRWIGVRIDAVEKGASPDEACSRLRGQIFGVWYRRGFLSCK